MIDVCVPRLPLLNLADDDASAAAAAAAGASSHVTLRS